MIAMNILMLSTWLREWRRRLAALVAPADEVVAPDDLCPHNIDAAVALRRLVYLAITDSQKFTAVLASFVECQGCAEAVITQFSYEYAGVALDYEPDIDDDAPQACPCEHPVNPEAMALRLALAFDSLGFADDGETLRADLAEIGCRSCLEKVLVSTTKANVMILEDAFVGWRPIVERRLKAILWDNSGEAVRPVDDELRAILDEEK